MHWYEVLGVFPALRALRLLRAAVITKRLHRLGIQVIPKRWVDSAKFYYHLLLEELSDRVILTAIDNFRAQIARDGAGVLNSFTRPLSVIVPKLSLPYSPYCVTS